MLSAEAIEKAQSGHPGAPMGLAEIATSIWSQTLRFDPNDLQWHARDRFILSCGHASMLLYSLLHLWDTGLSQEDLQQFRQWDSQTPGHPEVGHTPGVEMTTGPLGQGCATSVGVALAQEVFSQALQTHGSSADHPWKDQKTVVLCSDGDLMEGISYEVASLAGHWGLGKLVWFYDDNKITIDGSTALALSENMPQRFTAMGWRVLHVDGHDPKALSEVIDQSTAYSTQPTLVICRTHIGLGSPNKVDTSASHGAPLGASELSATKHSLQWEHEAFVVPDEVKILMQQAKQAKIQAKSTWQSEYDVWQATFPQAAAFADQFLNQKLNTNDLVEKFLQRVPAAGATRKLSNAVLEVAYQEVPQLLGGSADLSGSNGLSFKTFPPFGKPSHHENLSPQGRQLHFGIREHGMAAICNGLSLYGFKSFSGTFLIFSDYLRPAVRLAALSKIPSTFVLTHDSIFLGEDGPTHQPVEHTWALRLIPNCTDFRPADGVEVAMSWAWSLTEAQGPVALMLTRQGLAELNHGDDFDPYQIWKGAYVLEHEAGDSDSCDIALVATGSEVALAVESAQVLRKQGYSVRVVSMPSVSLFLQQDAQWQRSIIPQSALKVSIEAGSTLPWRAIVGLDGVCIGIDRFGASAPIKDLQHHFGFNAAAVVSRIQDQMTTRV
jgi:transketolase